MFAVTLPTYGGPDVLEWVEVPDPEPGPGDVLIDVVAAGVNRADLLQRAGFYSPPPGASPYPGMEVSGYIAAVGDSVSGWAPGDAVCALLTGGGYAEKVVVPAEHVLPVPRGIDVVDAAAFPEVACTVWSNLTRIAHMSHWQTLLVHGGGSGIGTFAIQYASALGVRVFTTARKAKHEVLEALGADLTIDYNEEDFVAEVKAATMGRGVELILDIQGGPYLNRNVDALCDGGRLMVIGLQGGRTGELDLGMMLAKRLTLSATVLRSRTDADKASIVAGAHADIWPLIESKQILPVIDRTIPMSQAAKAHEIVTASDHIGKVLLVTHSEPTADTTAATHNEPPETQGPPKVQGRASVDTQVRATRSTSVDTQDAAAHGTARHAGRAAETEDKARHASEAVNGDTKAEVTYAETSTEADHADTSVATAEGNVATEVADQQASVANGRAHSAEGRPPT